ncbi:DEAD/DEAH box helicase [Streptomyces griseocarneus]|uniref:DEAD/DEAH box helicase n=1 Tax=Streptomyces griseocarneus TaxID=51201 RepID=UPI001E46D1EF|nr:DEAD/DEAH box helicase [Streptomyces griseocarneus]
MTLPVALSGSDVIGQAKTGTGKTLGFGLPLLERVVVPADVEAGRAKPEQLTDAAQALIVVPTRELCQQVTNDLLTAGKVRNVRVQAIYGGRAYEPQVEALKKGVDVIVGTPGRLLDLAGQKKLSLAHIKALVLDEADEMLDLGFLPDVERIITMLPAKRQTMLFSATMPGAVISLARRYMSQPTHIRATSPDDEGQTHANIAQHIFRAHNMDKPEMVARILQAEGRNRAMIFCRTKRTAADISEQLTRRGFAAGAVHGDLGQGAREQALRAFRNGKVDVLVCTDVAARGIDVDDVTHVVNYQTPEDEKTYLHRIGRTGRAGKSGTAVTLVDWDDIPRWKLINKALDLPFDEPEETYSTSPHLYELLGIPAGTKGILPRSERTLAGLAAEEIEDLGEPGGRGRGDRDRDRGRGPKAATEERTERTRTPRQRRRTRGGSAVASAAAPAAPAAPVAEELSGAPETPARPRRRRRTRSGSAAAPAVAVAAPVTPVVTEAPAPVAETAVVAEAPAAKPKRTRTAKKAVAAVETVEAVAPVETVAAVETVVEKPKRTRTAKKAVAVVDTAEAVETVVEKPKRTRVAKKATAAPAEAAEVVETVVEKPKRTRTAKKAVAAVDTAEAVEAVEAEVKPKRTRVAKKAAAVVETAEAVETVETVVEKPKRTRTAKKAVAAVDTAEAVETVVEKPKRTRVAKKATAAVETAEAAETVAEKPKRTRTAKKAVAAVETAEGAEVVAEKPKRTRTTKKAAAVETTEEKPKRTRTAAKKAAAPAVEADAEAKPKRTRTAKKAAAPKAASA